VRSAGYRRTGWQGREQALADIRAGRVADGRAALADALRLAGSSLDAPQARDTARRTLGGQAFEQAYRRGRELGYDEALGLAEETTRTSPER
jgi:hypothetical protein